MPSKMLIFKAFCCNNVKGSLAANYILTTAKEFRRDPEEFQEIIRRESARKA
jgi:hypothetical protein